MTQELFKSLRSENPSDRWKAASLLVGAARAQNAEALAALADALEDDHPFVRWCAGLTLVQAGRSQAMATLLSALDKGPFRRQAAAADALAYARKVNPEPLLHTLSSEDAIVRQSAAEALGRLGYRPAISHLIASLTDDSAWVRRAATRALAHIGDSGAIDPLTQRVSDDSPWVRRSAVYALGAIRAKQSVSALITALDDPDPQVRRNAAWALGRIRDLAALPRLRALQADATLDEEFVQEVDTAVNTIQRPGLRRLHSVRQKWLMRRMASTS